MKKILLLLLFVTGFANAQINFNDQNFKNKLIALGIGSGGQITATEAAAVTSLDISNSLITDITEISSFTSLTSLNCSNNAIASLDVTALTQLVTLNCSYNLIANLDVTSLTQLVTLECYYNSIVNLNVTGLSHLATLNCWNNNLGSLNLTGLPALTTLNCFQNTLAALNVDLLTTLTHLDCSANQIGSLNVSPLVNLTYLNCYANLIGSLDVAPLVNLVDLNCGYNSIPTLNVTPLVNLIKLDFGSPVFQTINLTTLVNLTKLYIDGTMQTSIDLSHNVKLDDTYISYTNLTSIDVSACTSSPAMSNFRLNNNPGLTHLNIKDGRTSHQFMFNSCPNLVYICANDSEMLSVAAEINNGFGNNANVQINSYCSFVPGGAYNTISGTTYFNSGSGCGVGGTTINNLKMGISDGTNSGSTFSNGSGTYVFTVQQPNLTITPSIENPTYFNFTPTSALLNFPTNNNSTQTRDFCVTANGVHPDLEIVLIPIIRARPGFDATYKLVYKNKGNQMASGTVDLFFDDYLTDFISATPNVYVQTLNTLTWNYAGLMPFETRVIYFTLNINSPTETPAVNDGDQLGFGMTINPIIGDDTTDDNSMDYSQTVANSHDPNDKTCLEGDIIAPAKIGEYLHYNINFENTGSASAINIVVKDVIDPAKYDINSLQFINASHPVKTRITGNVVEFIFEAINLPPTVTDPTLSHGNVAFKIKSLPTLVLGEQVANTANIYFDYNFPVITNTATSTFNTLSTAGFTFDHSVTVYPNPTRNNVMVKAKTAITSIQIFDVQGRVLQTVIENTDAALLDVSDKRNGVYFLKVNTMQGSSIEKIIKE